MPKHQPNRRTAIAKISAVACLRLGALALVGPAQAQVVNVTGAELEAMQLKPEGITLDFAPLADTGFSVPLAANLQAPPGLKIQMVEVFLPENPNTRALKLRLIEPQSSYHFSTRLRLAGSQEAWVVVTLTDGSKRGAHAPTIVTSSACFDGS